MRAFFLLLALLPVLLSCGSQGTTQIAQTGETNSPGISDKKRSVLVELFTSEGCSSCPPADRALTFLEAKQPAAGVEIITLSFHVDYWDRIGWKDRFSSPQFSQRQAEYVRHFRLDSSYTPQMVVGGEAEFVGSNLGRATELLAKAALQPAGLAEIIWDEGGIRVKLRDLPQHSGASVFAALAEDGISTDVKAGENRGKKLEHTSVVRELRSIGALAAGVFSFEAAFPELTNSEAKKENLKIVVFAQEESTRRILAVGKAPNFN